MPVDGPEILDPDRLLELVREVVTQAAEAGQCVIVGRGAPYFLRNRSDTFSAFLYAPRMLKLERIKGQVNNDAEAENLVDSVDQGRAAFIKHYFGKDWPNRHLYHLMVNTMIGIESSVELLLRTMQVAGESEPTAVDLD